MPSTWGPLRKEVPVHSPGPWMGESSLCEAVGHHYLLPSPLLTPTARVIIHGFLLTIMSQEAISFPSRQGQRGRSLMTW